VSGPPSTNGNDPRWCWARGGTLVRVLRARAVSWSSRIGARCIAAIHDAGPDHRRIWTLYMTAATRTFERRELSVFQILASRPGGRG